MCTLTGECNIAERDVFGNCCLCAKIKAMTCQEIVSDLKKQRNPKNIAGMARFGINPRTTLGISMPYLRSWAKRIGKNQKLALELWETDIHEARILAGLIGEPDKITAKQMDHWVAGLDSWDVCDTLCLNLFDKTKIAYPKAKFWAKSKIEFTRRAGFALMAGLACHDKTASNQKLMEFFPLIKKYSIDERNFVRKAVNWALRQIGKRNKSLCLQAMKLAEEIRSIDTKASRWIASNALSELKQKLPKLK